MVAAAFVAPGAKSIRAIAPTALRVLGLRTGLTHLEWFRRPDGSIAVSEVAVRPLGAQITSMLCYAHDFAGIPGRIHPHGVVPEGRRRGGLRRDRRSAARRAHGRPDELRHRRRPVLGLGASRHARAEFGAHVAAVDLLPVGAQRRDWRATSLSDGVVVVRHRELAKTIEMADRFAADLHLYAG